VALWCCRCRLTGRCMSWTWWNWLRRSASTESQCPWLHLKHQNSSSSALPELRYKNDRGDLCVANAATFRTCRYTFVQNFGLKLNNFFGSFDFYTFRWFLSASVQYTMSTAEIGVNTLWSAADILSTGDIHGPRLTIFLKLHISASEGLQLLQCAGIVDLEMGEV